MSFRYIDIHSHVNFSVFDEDRDDVIQGALGADTWMIAVGTQYDTSRSAAGLTKQYPHGLYATVGLHPIHTSSTHLDPKELGGGKTLKTRSEVFDIKAYRALAAEPAVVAIGECGLDYYRLEKGTKQKQLDAFEAQIELAQELGKPLMLHVREAYEDVLDVLAHYPEATGNVHFFAGSPDIARKFLDRGFTLSFTGVITFSEDYDEVIRNVPLDMLMSETDAPYVTPAPYRGRRNEPRFVHYVVEKIAHVRNEPLERVQEQLAQNARRVFALPS